MYSCTWLSECSLVAMQSTVTDVVGCLSTQTWRGRFVLAEGARGMDAWSGLQTSRGEEDRLLSVKSVWTSSV